MHVTLLTARRSAGALAIGIGWAAGLGAAPHVFQAGEILKPEVLKGPHHTVEERVGLKGNRYVFELRTPYGRVTATGLDMLEIRLREMEALAAADHMTRQSQELAGLKDSLKKTREGLHALLTDPVDALESVPKGAGRKLESLTRKSTYGGGESRRKLAARLGCDPETRNALLRKRMDEVVLRRSLGQGITGAVAFGLTGGAALAAQGASVMRTTAQMREALQSQPLYKINDSTEAELVRNGVRQEGAALFAEHRQFTTLQRLQLIGQLRRMAGLPDWPHLLDLANTARSEEEALGAIHATALLASVHQQVRLTEVIRMPFPAGRLADQRVVAVTAVDYLTTGTELAALIARLREERSPILLAAGGVAGEARAALAAAGITLVEHGAVDRVR